MLDPNLGVDETVELFYDKLLIGINIFVPKRRVKRSSHPSWYNRIILRLKNAKARKFRIWIASRRNADYLIYSRYCKRLRQEKSKAFKSYLARTQNELKHNPKAFWSYVNSKRKSPAIPSIVSFNGCSRSDRSGICNLFADYFESVYSPETSSSVSYPNGASLEVREFGDIGYLQLACEDVLEALLKLNTRKGKGPDCLPPLLLKMCAYELCYPLCCLFNRSLYDGVFPEKWKLSHITPIFKSGTRTNVSNYRGVAVLPTLGKFFESIICTKLTGLYRNYISTRQHGFMKGRSTLTNLIEFTQIGLDTIETGRQLDVVYTDFQKAFDRVDHSLLLAKLERIGMHSSMLDWIRSYLTDRRQYVVVDGVKSRVFPVLSGVPQGSHLGPLLFLLFVNDIVNIFKYSKCLLYADDLKIFCGISNVRDAIGLQRDLDSLFSWCQENRLYLNLTKCKVMSYHRKVNAICFEYKLNNSALERVQQMSDLGVLFDQKFCFSSHIESMVSRAYSRLGFMKRICNDFNDVYCLSSVYYSLVRSVLEYASVVWNPGYAVHSDRIESIQRKFLLYALRRLPWRRDTFVLPSYESRCMLIDMEPLVDRRRNASLLFLYDLLSGRVDSVDLMSLFYFNVPPRSLRNNNLMHVIPRRTNYGMFSPVNRLSVLFNEHGMSFNFNMSRECFRREIRSGNLSF